MSDKKQPNKDKKQGKDLKNYNIKINEFGEIVSSMDVEQINEHLDENMDDKKLVDRKDSKDKSE